MSNFNSVELITNLIEENEKRDLLDGKALDALEQRAKMLIRKIFGETSHYLEDLKKILHPGSSAFLPYADRETQLRLEREKRAEEKGKLHNLFVIMLEDVNLPVVSSTKLVNAENSSRVFIVHGHDDSMKHSVARCVEKLNLTPVILHEQVDSGRTIIEKFENFSNVGFAIILLSPDDIAYQQTQKPENAKFRARQNVILELGFFMGKLGRERTFALVQGDIEIPSDYSGVVYTPYDGAEGGWRVKLVKELKALNYDVDANELFK